VVVSVLAAMAAKVTVWVKRICTLLVLVSTLSPTVVVLTTKEAYSLQFIAQVGGNADIHALLRC
jgi:hypothetical protein